MDERLPESEDPARYGDEAEAAEHEQMLPGPGPDPDEDLPDDAGDDTGMEEETGAREGMRRRRTPRPLSDNQHFG